MESDAEVSEKIQTVSKFNPISRLNNTIPSLLKMYTGPSLTENTIPDAVLIQIDLLMMNTDLHETCRGL